MRIHHSTQSLFSNPIMSQQDAGSDDSTPFTLPGDDSNDGDEAASPSITSSGIPSSISAGFWINQAGDSSTSSDSGANQSGGTAPSINGSKSSGDSSSQDILDEFAKWANMTPAQKIRAHYLEEHHLTEESFSKLPADEQKAINDQIADEIKRTLGVDDKGDGSDDSDGAASALSVV